LSPCHPLRIVIPVVAGIGNALMAVPMVRQLKRKIPGARISILARTGAMADVFRRLNEVEEVLVTGAGVKGAWRNVADVRARKPDVYLVPFPSNRWQYSVMALLSGAKWKVLHAYPVGYWRAMHFFPSQRVEAKRGIHDVEQNLNLLRALGIEPDAPEPPTFPLTEDDRLQAASRLSASFPHASFAHASSPIVIHAGSAQTVLAQAKRWSTDSYRQLVANLEQEFGADRIILVEGPDEAGIASQIAPKGNILKLDGPLAHAAAILERAALYIGSDSGLAHLAAAVGTPAVTLFAPADPDRVSPFGYRDLVVQAPTPCAPCFQYPWNCPYPKSLCREPMCITTITVESVMDAVRRAMHSAKRQAGGGSMGETAAQHTQSTTESA
jgi:ADP-heptose:LPS heptosyltransferase